MKKNILAKVLSMLFLSAVCTAPSMQAGMMESLQMLTSVVSWSASNLPTVGSVVFGTYFWVTGFQAQHEKTQKLVAELGKKIDALEKAMPNIVNEELKPLKKALDELKTDLNKNGTSLTEIAQKLSALEESLPAAIDKKIDAAIARFEEARKEDAEETQKQLAEQKVALKKEIQLVGADLAKCMAKQQTLLDNQQKQTIIQEQLLASVAKASTTEDLTFARNEIADLRKLITSFHNKLVGADVVEKTIQNLVEENKKLTAEVTELKSDLKEILALARKTNTTVGQIQITTDANAAEQSQYNQFNALASAIVLSPHVKISHQGVFNRLTPSSHGYDLQQLTNGSE